MSRALKGDRIPPYSSMTMAHLTSCGDRAERATARCFLTICVQWCLAPRSTSPSSLPMSTRGPWLHKYNGKYYLSYPGLVGGEWPEKMFYAVADKPLGPYTFKGCAPSMASPSRTMKPPPTESQVSSRSASPSAPKAMKRIVLGWRGEVVAKSNTISACGSKRICRPRRAAASGRRRLRQQRLGMIGIDGLRRLAGKAEDDRPVRRMAFAGKGERAEQGRLDALDPGCGAVRGKARDKRPRRFHRPDRMRGRGSDADLEEFKYADQWRAHDAQSGALQQP